NLVNAMDGGKSRILMNRGHLRFADESAARGLDGATRKTFLGHWFDHDGDGKRDLIVINDFARNALYRNLGNGHLAKVEVPSFTENGFSMGISTADFDNDGKLDAFVSKMFSYAGNRVLAITEDV